MRQKLKASVHRFCVDDAKEYSVHGAILLQNLKHWIAKNKAQQKNFRDGRTWTYNSHKNFAKLFPYLSESQIQRALANLEKKGAILKGNYNKAPYDRTTWYAVADESKLPT
jgi:hypothetical protein